MESSKGVECSADIGGEQVAQTWKSELQWK